MFNILTSLSLISFFSYIHSEVCTSYYKCLDSSLAEDDNILPNKIQRRKKILSPSPFVLARRDIHVVLSQAPPSPTVKNLLNLLS